jgi:sensor c-di-GMP phosphodiesterase-like protein
VETAGQQRLLKEMGCPLIQGFITSRALTAEDFEVFWAEREGAVERMVAESVTTPAVDAPASS